MSLIQLGSVSPDETIIKLPHPYLTEYTVRKVSSTSSDAVLFQIAEKAGTASKPTPVGLHNAKLRFTEPTDLKSSELPAPGNNGAWARARKSPCSTVSWDGEEAPTLAQAWLLLYILFTVRPTMESLRLEIKGRNALNLGQQLADVLLATQHPLPAKQEPTVPTSSDEGLVLALRSTFWQGAGSPFGPRPVWCPDESPASLTESTPLASYPLTPVEHIITVASAGDPQDPERQYQAWHPIRPAKPAPGAVIYSRWIPHLKENFSMVSMDWQDEAHLHLFHEWQNDPRVSQGWNETGTLEQHREYLRKIHVDPHQVAVLAKWDDTPFAYFELYWAKVSSFILQQLINAVLMVSIGGPFGWLL